MKIAVSGATGLVGSALVPALAARGDQVIRLARHKPAAGAPEIHWNPDGPATPFTFEGLDAVVHLAGENIAARWTEKKKEAILQSRVKSTRQIAESLATMVKPPQVWVCASAIGYYGDRGDEVLREESGPGKDFLAQVCQEWEAASQPAAEVGLRVVQLRFGIVLSKRGGALSRMLFPFRLGFGGRVGSGRQWWSWIAIDDVVGAIQHALQNEKLSGPVNTAAPHAVRNAEFTTVLGQTMRRPTVFPLPAFAARAAFGEMADHLLLASQRVDPAKLAASGYNFRYPELPAALAAILQS